jgi:hypothetical protein
MSDIALCAGCIWFINLLLVFFALGLVLCDRFLRCPKVRGLLKVPEDILLLIGVTSFPKGQLSLAGGIRPFGLSMFSTGDISMQVNINTHTSGSWQTSFDPKISECGNAAG